MDQKGLRMDVVALSSAISVCPWRQALELGAEMERRGISADEMAFTALLGACEPWAPLSHLEARL